MIVHNGWGFALGEVRPTGGQNEQLHIIEHNYTQIAWKQQKNKCKVLPWISDHPPPPPLREDGTFVNNYKCFHNKMIS